LCGSLPNKRKKNVNGLCIDLGFSERRTKQENKAGKHRKVQLHEVK